MSRSILRNCIAAILGVSCLLGASSVSASVPGTEPPSSDRGSSSDGRVLSADKSKAEAANVGTYIVGGAPISVSSVPWQVLLVDLDNDYWTSNGRPDGYFPFCGGSIIARHWVVTAAHCVDNGIGWTQLPFLNIAAGTSTSAGIAHASLITVREIIIHPRWNRSTITNDIALLRFDESVDLTTVGTPIGLPVNQPPSWPAAGTPAYISGWGRTAQGSPAPSDLRGAAVQIMASPGDGCGWWGTSYRASSMVCAGVPDGSKDTCSGDSGGPLAIETSGSWLLAGITSWGLNQCGTPNYPGVYTRVTQFLSWLQPYVSSPQSRPSNLSVTSAHKSLQIAFTPPDPGAAPITRYEYSVNGGSWKRTSATSSPVTVTGLSNGVSYAVRVRAVNVWGNGPASDAVTGIPLPDLPGVPRLQKLISGNGSIRVEYRAPNTGGTPVTGYQYSVDGGGWLAAAQPLTLAGLTNGQSYTVRIRAVNRRGPGDPLSISGTPRTVPGAPVISVTRSNGMLSVEVTQGTDGGAPITNYQYQLNNGSWTTRSPASVDSPILITGVKNGITYTVRVRAVNAAGSGSTSNMVTIAPL